MNKIEQYFKKDKLLTKAEILKSILSYIQAIKGGIDTDLTPEYIDIEARICKELYNKINATMLPDLNEFGWDYEYYFSGEGAVLRLQHESDFVLDKTESYIESSSIDCMYDLIVVNGRLLTVEEYAKLQNVKDVTVRQWIRRGKLRFAKKLGSQWFIPEMSYVPKRGYTNVAYFIKDDETLCIEGYPCMPGGSTIEIYQDYYDKNVFNCSFDGGKQAPLELELDRKQVEKLELEIIASGKARADEVRIQFVPGKE